MPAADVSLRPFPAVGERSPALRITVALLWFSGKLLECPKGQRQNRWEQVGLPHGGWDSLGPPNPMRSPATCEGLCKVRGPSPPSPDWGTVVQRGTSPPKAAQMVGEVPEFPPPSAGPIWEASSFGGRGRRRNCLVISDIDQHSHHLIKKYIKTVPDNDRPVTREPLERGLHAGVTAKSDALAVPAPR